MSEEFDYIAWIRQQQKGSALVRVGIGDDLAVLNWPGGDLLLVGVDQVLDGVHFDSAIHSPREIGRKAMNRNLSDCAAMGCSPAAALAAVILPKGVGDIYAKDLYRGLKEAGDAFDCLIVGGDTSSWPGKLVVTVTILGKSATLNPVTRSGAKPGDHIYVTGPLGGSILGRHMTFVPKISTGVAVAKENVTAMIDLSDGISRDLAHICRQSGVGAIIHAAQIPVHADAVEMQRDAHSPLDHALHDGEDYELLFTSPELFSNPDYYRVGTITTAGDIWLEQPDGSRKPLEPKSWQHTF